jgi:hypothetical protein
MKGGFRPPFINNLSRTTIDKNIKTSRVKASWYGTMLTEPNGNELSAYGAR